MFANTKLEYFVDFTKPYYYSEINNHTIYNDFELDPLTNEEISDLKKSVEDLRSGRYKSFDDEMQLMSYLDKL